MAFRVSRFRDVNFNDTNGTNTWDVMTTVYCDTMSDLPGMSDINHYHLVIGCRAIVIDSGKRYLLSSSGTWVESESGGVGGKIDTQVNATSTNPVQNKAIYSFVMEQTGGNTDTYAKTTAEWESDPALISQVNTIYVYTDFDNIGGENIPAIKLGDGVTAIVNLPFLAGSSSTVTPQKISFWDDKVTAYADPFDVETLVLSKTSPELNH